MSKVAGIVTSLNEVDLVVLEEDAGTFTLHSSLALKTRIGDRAKAYHILYEQLAEILRESEAEYVCIKGETANLDGTRPEQPQAAELRGVVIAAAASTGDVKICSDSNSHKVFGGRKLEACLSDETLWKDLGLARLKKEMRGAAFAVISQSN